MKIFLACASVFFGLAVAGCGTSDEIMQPQFNHGICELGGECQPPAEDPDPTAPGIWIDGYSLDECLGSMQPLNDTDGDGLDQGCEYRLATAFAPELVIERDCVWDADRDVLGGEYMYAVEGVSGYIRIAYLPAYYWDCGTARAGFLEGWFGDGAHIGDSEFISVEVEYNSITQHWLTRRVFLSAHCGEDNAECKWYSSSNFNFVGSKQKGAPIVWVSASKHANYPSKNSCESASLYYEICTDAARYRFPFVGNEFTQNIGSRSTPLRDCIQPFWGSPMAESGLTECFFTVRRFKGWQSETGYGIGSDSYSTHLENHLEI